MGCGVSSPAGVAVTEDSKTAKDDRDSCRASTQPSVTEDGGSPTRAAGRVGSSSAGTRKQPIATSSAEGATCSPGLLDTPLSPQGPERVSIGLRGDAGSQLSSMPGSPAGSSSSPSRSPRKPTHMCLQPLSPTLVAAANAHAAAAAAAAGPAAINVPPPAAAAAAASSSSSRGPSTPNACGPAACSPSGGGLPPAHMSLSMSMSASLPPSRAASMGQAQAQEAAAAVGGPTAPEDDHHASSRLGITLRGLRRMMARLVAEFGQEEVGRMTTADVTSRWVQAVTARRRCRLLEMAGEGGACPVAAEDVGPPAYFVSHAWKNRLVVLVEYLAAFLRSAADTVTVWLDILAVNQHAGSREQAADVHPDAFSAVVAACWAGTIVVMDAELVNPATRAWCVFEWAHTLTLHGPDGLHMSLRPRDRASLAATIDVGQAQAFKQEDKDMILGEVVRHHGSVEAFNASLRLQLLLEPLSCRVDVTRLVRRAQAAATRWDWGALDAWLGLANPETAPHQRALVVAGGAGEGKSSAGAALLSGHRLAGGDGGPAVAAHHFFKYSDQRRQEPVRVIKSLAFQLAMRFPDIQHCLLRLDPRTVAQLTGSGPDDVQQAFALLLQQPLQVLHVAHPDQPVLLLLDALDEAEPLQQQQPLPPPSPREGQLGQQQQQPPPPARPRAAARCPVPCGNRALQLVAEHLHLLPPSVRFVLTTRPDAAAGQVLPCLERTFGVVKVLAPAALRTACSAEPAGAAATAGKGAAAAGGVMLYHTVASEAVEAAGGGGGSSHGGASAAAGGVGGSSRGAAAALAAARAAAEAPLERPPAMSDVHRLYAAVFSTARPAPGGAAQRLLAVLLAAQEPLPLAFLQQLGVAEAVRALPGYPTLFFVDEHHLYLLHRSLADWLSDPRVSGEHAADTAAGHEQLGLHLAATWRSSSWPYTLRYVLHHLCRALAAGSERTAASAASTLDALLADFDFQQALLAAGHGPAAVAALGSLERSRHTGWTYDALRWLRQEQHALAGRGTGEMVRRALVAAPVRTLLYGAAVAAAGARWRTAMVLPAWQGDWPACQAVLLGHSHFVTAVAFSPDGAHLASSSDDKSIRLWDVATGRCAAHLAGHAEPVRCVAFSPDGRSLASGAKDGCVVVWDVATGQVVACARHEPPGCSVHALAWGPPGACWALATGGVDGGVRLWTWAAAATAAAPSAAAGGAPSPPPAPSLVVAHTLAEHLGAVEGVAFSADGCRLASCGKDFSVRLWDVAAGVAAGGRCLTTLQGHTHAVNAVAFSPDGKRLVSASDDASLRVWCAASYECLATLTEHSYNVLSVAFSADGSRLASGAFDDTVRLWDAEPGGSWRCLAALTGHHTGVRCVAFSPDGRSLASGAGDEGVRLWDVASASAPASVALATAAAATGAPPDAAQAAALAGGHESGVSYVSFSPDGRAIASASGDRTLRLWDAASGVCTAVLRGHAECVYSVAFSADGRWLVSGSEDHSVRVWDAAAAAGGTCVAVLEGHTDAVRGAVFSPDAARVVSASYDKTLRLWAWEPPPPGGASADKARGGAAVAADDGGDGEAPAAAPAPGAACLAVLEGHGAEVNAVAFSPDGTRIASGSDDCTVRLWDAAAAAGSGGGSSAALVSVLEGHTQAVFGVAFAPSGRVVASCGRDESICLWDAPTGMCVATLAGHTYMVDTVAFSPDGLLLVSSSHDRSVRLWDPVEGRCVAAMLGHSDWALCAAFSPSGRRIVSGGSDDVLRVWEALPGGPVAGRNAGKKKHHQHGGSGGGKDGGGGGVGGVGASSSSSKPGAAGKGKGSGPAACKY